jgi:3-oxoacyl-[acyl-carrier-protein] synthase-3
LIENLREATMFIAKKSLAAKVTGTGHFLPSKVVTNFDLEKLMDTSDEWIRQRSGIVERRFVEDGQTASDLAFEASEMALKNAGMSAQEIDLVLVATLTPEHYFPGTCSFLQHRLGLATTPAMEVKGQCSGFIYALSMAKAFIESGMYKNILVCCVEVHSRALDFTDRGRDMAVLFGDGAGACVLTATEHIETGILNVCLHSQGEFANKLWMRYPTSSESPMISKEAIDEGLLFPKMDGRFVFKHAVSRMPEVLKRTVSELNLDCDDINLFLFHQANLRINEHVGASLKIPPEKCFNNIERYGNCSAASIPIALSECVEQGRVNPGDLICMTAFGSGFTWGSAVLRWA